MNGIVDSFGACFCAIRAMAIVAAIAAAGHCSREAPPHAASRPTVPRRIISISPNSTEIIGALGAADRLVAVSDFCLWPEQVKRLPRVGGLFDANPEAILKLEPDLVVLRGMNRTVEQLCLDNGIALFRDKTDSFEDIFTTLQALGDILDCSERAQAAEKDVRDRLVRLAELLEGRPRPRVLITIARDGSAIASVMTASKGSFVNDMIHFAGGVNVFGDLSTAYPSISQEAILVARPDVIIEAMPEVKLTPELEARFQGQWKAFPMVPAVQNGRVYIFNDENITIPSPRIINVIEKIAKLLHPEVKFD